MAQLIWNSRMNNPTSQPTTFGDELVAAFHAGRLDGIIAETDAEYERGEALDSLTDPPVTRTTPESKARDVALKKFLEHFRKLGS